MLSAVHEKCSYWFYEAQFQIYLFFFRLTIWLRQSVAYGTSPALRNAAPQSGSILLIGDGLAEGVGDNLARGGLSGRLNSLVHEHVEQTGLKFNWEFFTHGRMNSTSEDWLPVQPGGSGSDQNTLFHRALISGPFKSSQVVVLIVGSDDPEDGSMNTVENIAQTADAIARLGKQVLVAKLPCLSPADSDDGQAVHAKNLLLESALSSLPSEDNKDKGTVAFGIDPQRVLVRGGDVVNVENSCVTLNAFGYRAYARDVHDEVAMLAKRVEWAYFKTRLGR